MHKNRPARIRLNHGFAAFLMHKSGRNMQQKGCSGERIGGAMRFG